MLRSILVFLVVLAFSACAEPDAPSEAAMPIPTTTTADTSAVPAEMAASQALGEGDIAPDFALPGVDGETVQLAALLERGPVVLTFYRGSWCPYCNTQLRDYQERLGEIEARGATLVAISPQIPDSSLSMQEKNDLAFPVLSDIGGEVSDAYGLTFQVDAATRERYQAVGVDLAEANGTDAWELPVPGTYVIAPDGTIRAAFVEADYTQRASVQQILDALARV
ncbi:MAG TPA: AhpC/TSA family protein [Bacteroidetes bacterium]|nr:AhpC/TSA family protein [Bacteroidota bacterium]